MNNLQGLRVLVTRPNPGGEKLCQAIINQGGMAIHFPTIEIVPPVNPQQFQQLIASLDKFDWVIFISPQAVIASTALITSTWPRLPSNVKLAAVGNGTATLLQEQGFFVHTQPKEQWGSEGLLSLPIFNSVSKLNIAIVRGAGGRELLAETLKQRGADVTYIEAYERKLPNASIEPYISLLQQKLVLAVICTSFEGVANFKKLAGKKIWSLIKEIPLIVVSERIKRLAQDLQFQTIWVAPNASDKAILELLADRRNA